MNTAEKPAEIADKVPEAAEAIVAVEAGCPFTVPSVKVNCWVICRTVLALSRRTPRPPAEGVPGQLLVGWTLATAVSTAPNSVGALVSKPGSWVAACWICWIPLDKPQAIKNNIIRGIINKRVWRIFLTPIWVDFIILCPTNNST